MSGVDDKITSLLSENRLFEPPAEGRVTAWVGDIDTYESVYKKSIEDPQTYWAERAEEPYETSTMEASSMW